MRGFRHGFSQAVEYLDGVLGLTRLLPYELLDVGLNALHGKKPIYGD